MLSPIHTLVFILGLSRTAQGFLPAHAVLRAAPTSQPQQSLSLSRRCGVAAADGGEWDVESARKQLENLMGNGDDGHYLTTGSSSTMDTNTFAVADKVLPTSLTESTPKHQLTVIARVRRATEIELLLQLKESLNAADALHDFWINERGSKAARALQKADEVFQHGEASWNNAEHLFNQLIQEHGPTWAEPLHRLAMLYYLQGRLAEARTLEEYVLKIKPWHIGSLSNYVRIAESQRDVETALQWAAYRLPPRVGRRRTEWVDRSVKAARDSLANDEQRLSTFLGKLNIDREVDSAWQ